MHLHIRKYWQRYRSRGSYLAAAPKRMALQILLLSIIAPGACVHQANAQDHAEDKGPRVNSENPLIISTFSDVDIKPDGDLGKDLWSVARRVRFDQAALLRTRYPEAATLVASRWTAQYLYLAFWCYYQSLNIYQGEDPGPERWQLWEKDVVEAFINPEPSRPSHYYEFEVAPNNQWVDLEIDLTQHPMNDVHWNSGFEHATRIDAVHHIWTAEMRIPVTSMTHAAIDANAEWRLNFYRCDGPGVGKERRMLSWGPLPTDSGNSSFHQPASFGTIRFVSARGAAAR